MTTQTVNQVEVVRLNRLEGGGNVKAFCDISLFGAVVIKGLRVMDGKNGLFVSMPREQGKDGKWYETVRLLKDDVKGVIDSMVLEAYTG